MLNVLQEMKQAQSRAIDRLRSDNHKHIAHTALRNLVVSAYDPGSDILYMYTPVGGLVIGMRKYSHLILTELQQECPKIRELVIVGDIDN